MKIQDALNEAAEEAADQLTTLDDFVYSDLTDMFILGHKWTLEYLASCEDGFDDNAVIVDSNGNEWVSMEAVKLETSALKLEIETLTNKQKEK